MTFADFGRFPLLTFKLFLQYLIHHSKKEVFDVVSKLFPVKDSARLGISVFCCIFFPLEKRLLSGSPNTS